MTSLHSQLNYTGDDLFLTEFSMQFYDKVSITVKSGRGGDGSAAGRREKYVAYGGPSGGDGGNGGSVYIQANHNEYTLMAYRVNTTYKAQDGEHGKGKDLYGHAGEDKVLTVPVGTVVRDATTGEILASLQAHDEKVCIVKGGKGGLGNKHFVNAQKQRSTIALLGEPPLQKDLELELQLLADVGLVGAPSVGKSSLINAVSNVKAQVAEYHFTTLVPNLGVLSHREKSFTMIDIPGLIQGAATGKGLGNEFLRHILKSSLLVLTIDPARYEAGIQEALGLLGERETYLQQQYGEGSMSWSFDNNELVHTYAGEDQVIKKKWFFLFTKSDLLVDTEVREELRTMLYDGFAEQSGFALARKEFDAVSLFVSSATQEHIHEFLDYCLYHLDAVETPENQDASSTVEKAQDEPDCYQLGQEAMDYLLDDGYINEEESKKISLRAVEHPDLRYLTYVLPWGNDEAELWYRQRLEELRILPWMRSQGVKKGDILLIDSDYHGMDERWVKWE